MLTDRQTQVLSLIQQGYSNGEIATILHCTEGTIKQHVNAIFKRLKLKNRYQLIVYKAAN
jgi:DNA-binding NarL/FixJ family response regulator